MKTNRIFYNIAIILAITMFASFAFAAPTITIKTPSTPQKLDVQADVEIILEGLTQDDINKLKASGTAFTLEFETGLEFVPGSMQSTYFDLFQTQFDTVGTNPNPYTGPVNNIYDQPLVVNDDNISAKTRVAAARCIPTANSTDNKLASFKVQLKTPKTAGNYSITLMPTILNNPAAGYNEDTAIDVLVGSDPNKQPTEDGAYPVLIGSTMSPVIASVTYTDETIIDIDGDGIDDNWEKDNFDGSLDVAGIGTDNDQDGYLDSVESRRDGWDPKVMNPADPEDDGYDPATDCRVSHPWTKITGTLNNLSLYGKVYVGDELAPEGSFVAAFGPGGVTDCREVVAVEANGDFFMTILGDTNGDVITFKLKNYADCEIYDVSEQFSFTADSSTDKDLHVKTDVTMEVELGANWNWVSFNVMPDDTSLNAFFGENVSKVLEIKNQTKSAINQGARWIGSDLNLLSYIETGSMYKIKTTEAFTLKVTGTAVDPTKPIVLNQDWTWIAFTPQSCIEVRTAVDSVYSILDEIKSQTQSKIKFSETLFRGSLEDMCPGKGYAIKIKEPGSIIYNNQ